MTIVRWKFIITDTSLFKYFVNEIMIWWKCLMVFDLHINQTKIFQLKTIEFEDEIWSFSNSKYDRFYGMLEDWARKTHTYKRKMLNQFSSWSISRKCQSFDWNQALIYSFEQPTQFGYPASMFSCIQHKHSLLTHTFNPILRRERIQLGLPILIKISSTDKFMEYHKLLF